VRCKYNGTQVLSLVVVTLGVVCTTPSASAPEKQGAGAGTTGDYAVGIMMLAAALVG
jgi:hypothetical protein